MVILLKVLQIFELRKIY